MLELTTRASTEMATRARSAFGKRKNCSARMSCGFSFMAILLAGFAELVVDVTVEAAVPQTGRAVFAVISTLDVAGLGLRFTIGGAWEKSAPVHPTGR